jgi:hypothetical protein
MHSTKPTQANLQNKDLDRKGAQIIGKGHKCQDNSSPCFSVSIEIILQIGVHFPQVKNGENNETANLASLQLLVEGVT